MLELKPSLDSTSKRFGGEIGTFLFFFSFRDAVARAGYYKEGLPSTLSYHEELGTEINWACETNKIKCGKLIFSMVPLWHETHTKAFPSAFFNQFKTVIKFYWNLSSKIASLSVLYISTISTMAINFRHQS